MAVRRRQVCWVDRSDRTHVYLDVAEPLTLYGDLLAVGSCVLIALLFAVCIAREHRESLIHALHAADNPFDMDGGPRHPTVVDRASYDYTYGAPAGASVPADGGGAPSRPGCAAPVAAAWPQRSHEAGAKEAAACLW